LRGDVVIVAGEGAVAHAAVRQRKAAGDFGQERAERGFSADVAEVQGEERGAVVRAGGEDCGDARFEVGRGGNVGQVIGIFGEDDFFGVRDAYEVVERNTSPFYIGFPKTNALFSCDICRYFIISLIFII
jgi:hypothetical protein